MLYTVLVTAGLVLPPARRGAPRSLVPASRPTSGSAPGSVRGRFAATGSARPSVSHARRRPGDRQVRPGPL